MIALSRPVERVSRPRGTVGAGRRVARAWATMLALLCLTTAWAFEPAAGSEILLADAAGTMMVGYGRMTENGLQIHLARDAAEVRVVVIAPDGSATTFVGRLEDGRLRLRAEGGDEMDVADVLARDERTLTLSWPDAPAAVVPPRDAAGSEADAAGQAGGEGAEAPDQATPGSSGEAPGRSGEAPGRSGDAPGRSGEAPGRSGDAPGRSGDAPGRSEDGPSGRSGDRGGPPVRDLRLDPEGSLGSDGLDVTGAEDLPEAPLGDGDALP